MTRSWQELAGVHSECSSSAALREQVTAVHVTASPQDEVHERSGLTDFLLTKLRDVLQSVPSLKLILSGAALEVDLFRRYFASCSVVTREAFTISLLSGSFFYWRVSENQRRKRWDVSQVTRKLKSHSPSASETVSLRAELQKHHSHWMEDSHWGIWKWQIH